MTALAFPGTSDPVAQNVIGTFTSTTAGWLIVRLDAPLATDYLVGRINAAEDDDEFVAADITNADGGGVYIALPITGADDWRVYAYESGVYDAGLTGSGTFLPVEGDCLQHEGPLDNPGDDVTLDDPWVSGSLVVVMNGTPLIEDSGVGGGWDPVDPSTGELLIVESQMSGDMFDFYSLDPACVNPSAPGSGLFADWGEGFGHEDADLTTRISAPGGGFTIRRGVPSELTGGSYQDDATIVLKNDPDDRFNPENTGGPLYGLLKDGVRVWLGINEDGTIAYDAGKDVYGRFSGRITDITPLPVGGAAVAPYVELACAGQFEWLGRQQVRIPDARGRSQAAFRALILDEAGVVDRDLPAEPATLPLSAFDGKALDGLDAINKANGTRHYAKPANTSADWWTYVAQRRTEGLDGTTSASFDAGQEHITTAGWRRSADGIVNQVTATVEPIAFSALKDVWVADDPLPTVVSGTPFVVWAQFDDYVDAPLVDVAFTGSALTTDIDAFGRTAKVTLTSSGTSAVTHLAVQGYLAVRGSGVSYVKDDAASQAEPRGVRAGPDLSGDFLGTLTSAKGLADHIVYRFANPLYRPTLTIVTGDPGSTGDGMPEMFALDLLDRIEVTVAQLSVVRKFEIVGLTHTCTAAADDGGTPTAVYHEVTYVLQELREQADPGWFRLDHSALDGGDRLHA